MALFDKLKRDFDYLRGKADPSLYAEGYKSSNLSLEDWQKRWEIFSQHGCGFVWYGVDREGNLAEFSCENAYVPEAFFQNVRANRYIFEYFDNLPEITTTRLPENLSPISKKAAETFSKDNDFWKTGANRGIFIFEETDGYENPKNAYGTWISNKFPYELLLMPEQNLKVSEMPVEVQNLLKQYHFKNVKFDDCSKLDVSKYLYCEE